MVTLLNHLDLRRHRRVVVEKCETQCTACGLVRRNGMYHGLSMQSIGYGPEYSIKCPQCGVGVMGSNGSRFKTITGVVAVWKEEIAPRKRTPPRCSDETDVPEPLRTILSVLTEKSIRCAKKRVDLIQAELDGCDDDEPLEDPLLSVKEELDKGPRAGEEGCWGVLERIEDIVGDCQDDYGGMEDPLLAIYRFAVRGMDAEKPLLDELRKEFVARFRRHTKRRGKSTNDHTLRWHNGMLGLAAQVRGGIVMGTQ